MSVRERMFQRYNRVLILIEAAEENARVLGRELETFMSEYDDFMHEVKELLKTDSE